MNDADQDSESEIGTDFIRKIVREDLAAVGVRTQSVDGAELFGKHGLRRGAAQAMARAGWSEVTIQKFLRC